MQLPFLLHRYMAPMLLSFDNMHYFTVIFRRKLNLSEHRSFQVASAYSLKKNRAFDKLSANLISPSLYIYIKGQRERGKEREREDEINSQTVSTILTFPQFIRQMSTSSSSSSPSLCLSFSKLFYKVFLTRDLINVVTLSFTQIHGAHASII